MKKVGVVGSGNMGRGIAQTAAQFGYLAMLYDVDAGQLERAREGIGKSLERRVSKGKTSPQEKKEIEERIQYTAEIGLLSDCDVVIEAVVEKVDVKQQVFHQLEALVGKDCLLATNTSSLSLKEIGQGMNDASRLVGIHFFNPVPAMKLVEIVRTAVVREDIVAKARTFAESIGKTTILANDTPGFVVNYLQYPFRLNAIRMVERGMATPEDIDTAAKLALGHPMGPLELQDMVGLDVTYYATSSIYEKTGDVAMRPPELLKQMVEEGRLGRKTGEGFYRYKE